ncbi:MAG: DNA polymerase III subunit delta [Roseiflexaceae bacterium]|nr:DNA polymerase III subunit delta [Roseiflexaceae bacterium]
MIFLLHGPDEYRRSAALARLRATIPLDLRDLNSTTLDGRRLKLDTLVAACEAFPFIAEKRIVVVADLLKYQKAGADRDALRAYLERIPPTCDLIFVESEEFDKRNAIFTYLKKAAEVQEFAQLEAAELTRWLAERVQERKARLDPQAAQRLVAFVGGDTRALVNELEKLASYVGQGGRISIQVVDLLVQDEQEQNLFAFIDELSARRRGPALASVRRLLDEGQAATYIIFMVARQLRILLGVKELLSQRLRPDDIAAKLGQKPFVVRKALDQARGFTDEELVRLHDRVLMLDHATKTGRMEAETGLELLVAEFSV